MNDVFQRRVRGAAIAGWWTVLISDSRVDRVPGDEFRPPRVVPSAAWPRELGCAPECRALGHRRVEDLHLALGTGGRVAHALGSTAGEAGVLSC